MASEDIKASVAKSFTCPKCQSSDFVAQRAAGQVEYVRRCKGCGFTWNKSDDDKYLQEPS